MSFIQKREPDRYTLGIVYSPNTVDCQGDYADAQEIEKACHGFMNQLQDNSNINKAALEVIRKACSELGDASEIVIDMTDVYEDVAKGALGNMHEEWPDNLGDIVECYIMPIDCEIDGEQVKKGSWMMGVVWNSDYFQKIQKGEITGYSMGGSGNRTKGVCL